MAQTPTWDDVAEVQAILDHYRITPEAIKVLAEAEDAAIAEGVVVPLRPRK